MTEIYSVISTMADESSNVTELCDVLDVSRSAYYQWKRSVPTTYEAQDQELGPLIQAIFKQHRRRYGARRIVAELADQGIVCSRGKVRKIMDQMGLEAIQPKSFKPRTTESKHGLGYNENLLQRGMTITASNQVWVGDITYISLPERFAYLALLMDLYSRRIIGWSLELHMDASLVIQALRQAVRARQPRPGLIHHTDRGGQYAAHAYRAILERLKVKQSMSRAQDCYENAFMESCFGTIKTELEIKAYPSFAEAGREIREYINYYNTIRRHSALGYQSPNRFELANDR